MSGKNPLGSGKEPQSYEGINIIVPVGGWQLIKAKRDPTTNDKKYPVGALWINYSSENVWVQVNSPGVWIQLANSTGDLLISAPLTTEGVLYSTGTNTTTSTGAGTSGQVLQSGGSSAAPLYSTATYPATTTANQLLYSSATNTVGGLSTANSGVLITSTAGVPSILAAGTTGQMLTATTSAAPSWSTASYPQTTTANQILYSSAANTVTGLTSANNGVVTTGTSGTPAVTALANGQVIIGQGSASAPAAVYQTNQRNTYVPQFAGIPSMSASTGGVAAVTINTYNIWSFPEFGARMEQYNTTVATNIAPTVSTTAGKGLNIDNIGGSTSKSIEITEGNTVNSKNAFVIGTSAAFYVKYGFSIATLADVVSLTCGFRKVQTYQATLLTGYTDYACIGVQNSVANGEVQIQTQAGSGGETKTDTTQLVTAATNFTVEVLVSSAGVVTYLFNGAPPTVTAAYTFTSALTVIPFMVYTSASGGHAEVDLVSYQCGLQ